MQTNSQYVERVVNLLDPGLNRIYNMSVGEAENRILNGTPADVREIDGSFALMGKEGKRVRLARSMDRPMRYFLAKRHEGPALIVADRIDTLRDWLEKEGFGDQFHPSYTRMVPAHYVLEIQLIGCPDPDPTYIRFFDPPQNRHYKDLDEIGTAYIGQMVSETAKWLSSLEPHEPVGVCFSGGIDSGAVFLAVYHVMRKMGMNLSRLKAFTLTFGDGKDELQAKTFLDALNLGMFLEVIQGNPDEMNAVETIRVVEDYKPLDIECAAMSLALFKGIRSLYPDWKHLADGDGGDENLKDYPIEENPELTIRSVVNNLMLYHEGWGVGKIKHSLTFSGGLSRSYTRTYAPARKWGFQGFSPFTAPNVIETSEGIPFISLTDYDIERLYSLKGEVVKRGVKSVMGLDMPIFEKRRFQHGATDIRTLRQRLPGREMELRKAFLELFHA